MFPPGLPVPVRPSDVNGLPQDRPPRLGRTDSREEVTVLTEIVFDICPGFYPSALLAPLMLISFVRRHKLIFRLEQHGFLLIARARASIGGATHSDLYIAIPRSGDAKYERSNSNGATAAPYAIIIRI